jgi:hypothetical protein
MTPNAPLSTAQSVRARLCQGLDQLLAQPPGPRAPAARFEELRLFLEALPLDSAAFCVAVNRLANARQYVKSGEYGAARYELRLLRRSLES